MAATAEEMQHEGIAQAEGPGFASPTIAEPSAAAPKAELDFALSTGYKTRASAHRLGVFMFKGSSQPVHIVNVTTGQLLPRR